MSYSVLIWKCVIFYALFFKEEFKENYKTTAPTRIPHVFAVCPYRSVEIALAEVFNQLADNTSEKLI